MVNYTRHELAKNLNSLSHRDVHALLKLVREFDKQGIDLR